MDATKIFFNWNRDRLVSESVNQSKTRCEEMEIPVEKQSRRKRKLPGGKEDDVCQTLVQEVKRNLYECHDQLVNELEAWFDSTSHLQTVFAGLSSQAILEDTDGELEWKFKILSSEYSADLNVSRLPLEVLRFQKFLVAASKMVCDMTMTKSSAIQWLRWIYWWQVQETVPNIVIALRLQRETSQNWSSLKVTWDWVCHNITYPICPSFQLNMKLWRR